MKTRPFFIQYKQNIEQLLSSKNISLIYRVRRELLDEKEADLFSLHNEIEKSKPVKKIFAKMHPEGYWLQKKGTSGKLLGDGVEYTNFATTHFCLCYLSELGMDRSNALVEKASERYLNLQQTDGDWYGHMSCLNGYNIYTFIKLGYGQDDRILKNIDLMLDTLRFDGGYLCDMHEKYGKKKKSCIRGSAKMLLAISLLPELYNHPRVQQLVTYFLNRGGIYKSTDLNQPATRDMGIFSFPFTWGTNSWEILLALSKMGYGNDKRLKGAWNYIKEKTNDFSKFILEGSPSKTPYKFGKKGENNEWINFYVLLALKYKTEKGT